MARRRQTSSRRYPRTARLNELLREIIAEELERIDDERLGFFTVTAVEVDPGLEHAKIHWSDLGADDETVLAVLQEHRARLQRAVNNQTHLRRTPVLSFHADLVTRSATRIEEILRDIAPPGQSDEADDDGESSGIDENEDAGSEVLGEADESAEAAGQSDGAGADADEEPGA